MSNWIADEVRKLTHWFNKEHNELKARVEALEAIVLPPPKKDDKAKG